MLLTEFTTLLKNLWEKLMNNIKKYIKNIWTIMPMHTKKEKFYLNELKKHLNEYLDDHPQCYMMILFNNLESLRILL